MDLMTLIIVLAIVIPGYFVIKQISRSLYSDHNRMDEATEKRYGFQRLEKKMMEKTGEKDRIVTEEKNQYHRRAKMKRPKVKEKKQIAVVIEYRKRSKIENAKKRNKKMKNE